MEWELKGVDTIARGRGTFHVQGWSVKKIVRELHVFFAVAKINLAAIPEAYLVLNNLDEAPLNLPPPEMGRFFRCHRKGCHRALRRATTYAFPSVNPLASLETPILPPKKYKFSSPVSAIYNRHGIVRFQTLWGGGWF